MLIVDASYSSAEAYETPPFNPFADDADFEQGHNVPMPEMVE